MMPPHGLPWPPQRTTTLACCSICTAQTGKYGWEDGRLQLCRWCTKELGGPAGGARNLRVWLKEVPRVLAAAQAAFRLGKHAAVKALLEAERAA